MIRREVVSHKYTSTKVNSKEFSVETDYINEKIYISSPGDECESYIVKEFAKTLLRAAEDMEKYEAKEAAREEDEQRGS